MAEGKSFLDYYRIAAARIKAQIEAEANQKSASSSSIGLVEMSLPVKPTTHVKKLLSQALN